MKVQAVSRELKISAQKLRLVADVVRGKQANRALEELVVMPHKGARMVYDTVHSAMASAEHNYNLTRASLTIDEIRVDQGAHYKRFRPRARGRASQVIHPMAHLTVVLNDQPKEGVS